MFNDPLVEHPTTRTMDRISARMIYCLVERRRKCRKVRSSQPEIPTIESNLSKKLVDSFWKRWTRDVFPTMVLRKKWQVKRRNLQVADVVTYVEETAVRGKWTLGKVIETYPGRDGRIGNVKLKTPLGEYRRPVTKVAVVYPVEGYGEEA